MGLWLKITRFFGEVTEYFLASEPSPEVQINQLTSVMVAACSKGVPIGAGLAMLQQAAQQHPACADWAQLLLARLREATRPECDVELKSIYVVALGNTILDLMGEDTKSPWLRSLVSDEANEMLHLIASRQGPRISRVHLHQEALWYSLWNTFSLKSWWRDSEHPCWKVSRITDTEVWAKNEWNRAHPGSNANA